MSALHQAFHVDGITDAKAQEEKLARTGEFCFIHDHRQGENCNPGCHAINPAKARDKK